MQKAFSASLKSWPILICLTAFAIVARLIRPRLAGTGSTNDAVGGLAYILPGRGPCGWSKASTTQSWEWVLFNCRNDTLFWSRYWDTNSYICIMCPWSIAILQAKIELNEASKKGCWDQSFLCAVSYMQESAVLLAEGGQGGKQAQHSTAARFRYPLNYLRFNTTIAVTAVIEPPKPCNG